MTPSERRVAMIRVLRACGCCTSVELADRLGVAQRTVYRDTDALWAAGLPVVGLPGSGFTFEDGEPVVTVSLDGMEVAAAVEALRRYAEPWERPVWEALAKRLVEAAVAALFSVYNWGDA